MSLLTCLDTYSLLGMDDKLRIYNSHNHEYALARQIWTDSVARIHLEAVYRLENELIRHARLVFATSREEREAFIAMYGADPAKVKLAPNGIERIGAPRGYKATRGAPIALFIEAYYPPNLEAARFIIRKLADQCPNIQFVIAGGCCGPMSERYGKQPKRNVRLLGRISHDEKLQWLARADIAINPMFRGAGVNIKTLEFLAAGLPLFSTFGIRGLHLEDRLHYIRAEKDQFADKLNHYAHRQRRLSEIAKKGQQRMREQYTWERIAASMRKEIELVLS